MNGYGLKIAREWKKWQMHSGDWVGAILWLGPGYVIVLTMAVAPTEFFNWPGPPNFQRWCMYMMRFILDMIWPMSVALSVEYQKYVRYFSSTVQMGVYWSSKKFKIASYFCSQIYSESFRIGNVF